MVQGRCPMLSIALRLTVVTAMLLTGCATPPRVPTTRDETFVPEHWETVVVLPFTGEAAVRRPVSELFAYQMQKQPYFRILTPGFAELTLKRNGQALDATEISADQAQKFGKMVQAQGVLVGNISQVRGGVAVYVRAEIKLIDVSQGHVVARVDQASPPISWNEFDLAKVAEKQAAIEMMAILESLGKKAR